MMAMSATAASLTVFVMMLVVTVTISFTSASAITTAMQVVDKVLNLLLCGLAILGHHAAELQCFASQRMVQVHLHLLFRHLYYTTHEVVAVLVLQRHYGTLIDVLVVKVTIDGENFTLQIEHAFLFAVAISFVLCQLEGEGLTLLQILDLVFESLQSKAKAADKLKWTFRCGLFYEMLSILIYRVELVLHGDILVSTFFHFLFLCFRLQR